MPRLVNHQQRRAQLAEIAALMIARDGLEKTTIRSIAQESGYSKGIIEHYFDNKDDLIASALEWLNQRYAERVQRHIGQRTGLAALRIRLEQTLPLSTASRQEWSVRLRFWSLAAVDPQFQVEQSQRWQAARQAFIQDLKQAQEQGEVSADLDPVKATDHLLYLTSGVSVTTLHSPDSLTRNQLRQHLEEWLAQLPRACTAQH